MEFSAHWVFCTYYRFLVLAGKGPTAYVHLEMISKVFIILFLLCQWGLGIGN